MSDPQETDPLQFAEKPQVEKVCSLCLEQNLIQAIHVVECNQCFQKMCTHFASTIDPSKCNECLHDVSIEDKIELVTQEKYDEEKDKVYRKTRKVRHLTFGGAHFLFQARKINTMTNTDLFLAIEYHHGMLNAMVYEREQRRVDNFHRNAGKPNPVRFSSTTSETVETVTKRKRTISGNSQDKTAAKAAAALQQLISSGLSPEQILAAFSKKK